MARKKINTGDILQIPLWGKLGYAYAKYIDLVEVINQDMASFVKVFDYWTRTTEFDIEELRNSSYLIQPIMIAGIYPTLRKKIWTIVGKKEFAEDDDFIPHFRHHEPRFVEEREAKKWCYLSNCDMDNRTVINLDNIKHLERYGAKGTGLIEIRVTIQIIKKEGLKLEDYLDLNDETVRYQLKMAEESPLLSELPKPLQGRAKI